MYLLEADVRLALVGMLHLEIPPRSTAGTEVFLLPALKKDIITLILFDMLQSQGERGWTSDDSASRRVLGAMARTHKLILSLVPRHDTAEMGADSIESEIFEIGLVIIDDEVSSIATQALDQFTRACEMRGNIVCLFDFVTQSILGNCTARATAAGLGDEKIGEGTENAECNRTGRAGEK